MRTRTIEPSADEILNIVRSENDAQTKVRMLLSIGLQPYEARGLARLSEAESVEIAPAVIAPESVEIAPEIVEAFNVYTANADAARNALSAYTCGVEIECFARNTELSAAALAEGLVCRAEGYNHEDHINGEFKLVSDSSVCGFSNPTECVSPVLTYGESADKLTKICRALAAVGVKINKTCGLHVHIGARDLTDAEYCNVFVNYMYLQSLIDSFLPQSRRNSRWAKRLNMYESRVLVATTKRAMYVALNCDRYFAVNAHAYERHNTIEFRQHSGSVEYNKITNWLAFCVKLVEWSKNNRLTAESAPRTIDEIAFLNEAEKEYFKQRAARFAEREAVAAA